MSTSKCIYAAGNIGRYIAYLYQLLDTPVLDTPVDIEHSRMCDHTNCLNIRHYDVEFWARSRPKRIDLPSFNYRHVSLGDYDAVLTSWGDILPDPLESLALYESFRSTCFPYVSHAESPLTTSAVASIKFVPLTGCWAGDNYYRGELIESINGSYQHDGYANLYHKGSKEKSGAHKKAHRELWELFRCYSAVATTSITYAATGAAVTLCI